MAQLLAGAVTRVRHLLPELAKFGIVGATGSVVDLGGSAFLYGTVHLGPLTSKGIALSAACVVTYLGSRFWTFRHRENQPLARELALFIVLNGVGLLIAEIVIAITAYAVGNKDQLAYNAASIIGTGLGTIFRYFAYRKWVFLAPARPEITLGPFPQNAPSPPPAPPYPAVNGHRLRPATAATEANGVHGGDVGGATGVASRPVGRHRKTS